MDLNTFSTLTRLFKVVQIPQELKSAGWKVAQAFAQNQAEVILEDDSGQKLALKFQQLVSSLGLADLVLQSGAKPRGWIGTKASFEAKYKSSVATGETPDTKMVSDLSLAQQVKPFLIENFAATAERGKVTLIGGGPGDPKLLTLAAVEALASADIVFLDRLGVALNVLNLAPAATVIDVGKMPGRHKLAQAEINEKMAILAKAGAQVVRLKGGDVFVFGRGGEEWQFLAENGIQVEVIPGITSALAVPAIAGISATHREITRAVTIISGHQPFNAKELGALIDLGTTIIILMGVATLKSTIHGLIEAGMSPQLQIAVLEHGFSDNEKATFTTLNNALTSAVISDIKNPAVIVIGEVVEKRVRTRRFEGNK